MAERVSPPQSPGDEPVDVEALGSRLKELSDGVRVDLLDSAAQTSLLNSKDLLEDCLAEFLNARHEMELDDENIARLGSEDAEAFLEQLKKELTLVEDEQRKIEDQIMGLVKTIHEDSARLYSDIGALDYLLKLSNSMDIHKSQGTIANCGSVDGDPQGGAMYAFEDEKFKILQLDNEIEKSRCYLTCLKNLDSVFKRDEAIGQIEDTLSEEVKPIEFEENWIRLSIKTPVSSLDGSLLGQKLDSVIDPLVLYHELAIEVVDETMELKNIEIFPNDVCLDDIITSAKSSRQLFSLCSSPSFKSSLEWLVRKIKQQIFLCNLRHLVVKEASNSRHSFEYSDKDKTVTAHLAGEVDAFIKVSQGWPMSPSALHLVSIKNSAIHEKSFSLSFFYKIKELANSLDEQIRHHLPRFANAIEEIFVREMRQEI